MLPTLAEPELEVKHEFSIDDVRRIAESLNDGKKVGRSGRDYRTKCPQCRLLKLSINLGDNGNLVAHCHDCRIPFRKLIHILADLGLVPTRRATAPSPNLVKAISRADWTYRSGATDYAVLSALAAKAAADGVVQGAVRFVAGVAKIGDATASRSLGRLIARGWLLNLGREGVAGRKYKIIPSKRCNEMDQMPQQASDAILCSISLHPVWYTRALGKVAMRVYEALSFDAGCRSDDLRRRLGYKHRQSIETQLAKLFEHKLAIKAKDGWRRGDADLDDVARTLGFAGKAASERNRHDYERRSYRRSYAQWLADETNKEQGRTDNATGDLEMDDAEQQYASHLEWLDDPAGDRYHDPSPRQPESLDSPPLAMASGR